MWTGREKLWPGVGHSFALWQRTVAPKDRSTGRRRGPLSDHSEKKMSPLSYKSCCGSVSSSTQVTEKNT